MSDSSKTEKSTCQTCAETRTRKKWYTTTATVEVTTTAENIYYKAGSTTVPYRRQGGCFNGTSYYQALITKNEETARIMKKNVVTGKLTFSELIPMGHANNMFYLPTTNCVYVSCSSGGYYTFDADTLEYKGVGSLGNLSGYLFYLPKTNTYIHSSGAIYDESFKKISSITKEPGENIGATAQGYCADENYIYQLRCQGIGSEKYYTYVQIHDTSGKYIGTVTVKIPENFEPENISVVDGELYIAACTKQPVATLYKVVID